MINYDIPPSRKAILKRPVAVIIGGQNLKKGAKGIVVPSPVEPGKFLFFPSGGVRKKWKGLGVELKKEDFGYKSTDQLSLF